MRKKIRKARKNKTPGYKMQNISSFHFVHSFLKERNEGIEKVGPPKKKKGEMQRNGKKGKSTWICMWENAVG